MSQTSPPASSAMPGMPPPPKPPDPTQSKSVFLVSYPKVVFLYPTMIAALLAGIYQAIAKQEGPDTHVVSALFMTVFLVNLVVFSFDFPRTTSLTLFFFIAAIVLGALLLFRFNEDILPFVHKMLNAYKPQANTTFYFSVAGSLALIYLAVFINVQFDYWEVTPNELLHHHGFLSNLERFAAPNLKIDKEINDVFEYLLLRSGRLILHPSSEPRAIVLENVMGINAKEAILTKMLGALQVQVRPSPPS
jgi:hypothetical protein